MKHKKNLRKQSDDAAAIGGGGGGGECAVEGGEAAAEEGEEAATLNIVEQESPDAIKNKLNFFRMAELANNGSEQRPGTSAGRTEYDFIKCFIKDRILE